MFLAACQRWLTGAQLVTRDGPESPPGGGTRLGGAGMDLICAPLGG